MISFFWVIFGLIFVFDVFEILFCVDEEEVEFDDELLFFDLLFKV